MHQASQGVDSIHKMEFTTTDIDPTVMAKTILCTDPKKASHR